MPTLIVVLAVVISIGAILFMLAFLHDRQNKKRTEKMLRRFSELGSEYDLSFTAQEVLGNRVIGVDGLKGKLLYLEVDGADFEWSIIDLTEAKSCRVKKVHGNIPFLDAIALEFDFKNSPHTVALPFYKHVSQFAFIREAPELETKAKNWESVLVKMMTKEMKRA